MREIERRAAEEGLQPIRWPDPWPGNTLHAMRVATYAKSIGRTVSFTLAAFRQAFAGGRDLSDPDNVAIAAAACELHPNAIAKAAASSSVKRRLPRRHGDGRRPRRDRGAVGGRRRARSSGGTTGSAEAAVAADGDTSVG